MVAVLNKNSFYRIHKLPPFSHQNQPSRESIFCDKMSGWWTKRALTMLNLLLKTRQNSYAVNTRGGHRCRKHVRLRRPAWAVAGYATYILHHETQKLSAIDKRFSTCRECMEQLPPGCLFNSRSSHLFTLSPSHSLTFSPFHPFTLSSFHSFTFSLSHLFTLSPFHLFIFFTF